MIAILVLGVMTVCIRSRVDKGRIREYLSARGATDILITKVWFPTHEYTTTYDIAYTDPRGSRRTNRCKICYSLFTLDGRIYWRDPV
jgi:hypothetical protein